MTDEKRPFIYYGLTAITFCLLVYFSVTLQPRGDEGGAYLPAFQQAYTKWPALDMSPTWAISSFYLWAVDAMMFGLANLGFFADVLLPTGRLFSLLCWLILVYVHITSGRFKALAVLFNPYVLIYASRAHPLLPGMLLFYGFWTLIRQHKTMALLLLLFAVNFQVFIGGAIGLFTPTFPLDRRSVIRIAILGVVAVAGVFLTWYTWGGMYPVQFVNHAFFQQYHVNGKPSFGYPFTVFMLAGATFWISGNRTLTDIKKHATYSWVVIIGAILATVVLYFIADIVAIAREGSQVVLGKNYQIGWVIAYGVISLGWLRVHRDHYPLVFGLLGSAILLITLPYLYERISVFATIAPCLAWCGLAKKENQQVPLLVTACCVFVISSVFYQLYGSL